MKATGKSGMSRAFKISVAVLVVMNLLVVMSALTQ